MNAPTLIFGNSSIIFAIAKSFPLAELSP